MIQISDTIYIRAENITMLQLHSSGSIEVFVFGLSQPLLSSRKFSELVAEINGLPLAKTVENTTVADPLPDDSPQLTSREVLIKACAKDRGAVNKLLATHGVSKLSEASEEVQALVIAELRTML